MPNVGLYVSELQSDAGATPRNVCMLDVSMILACVCLNVSTFRSDVGESPRNAYML